MDRIAGIEVRPARVFKRGTLRAALTVFVALTGMALSCPGHAATLFVSTVGNDTSGNGSSASPWRSVLKAVGAAAAGDVIHVGPGVFAEDDKLNLPVRVSLEGSGRSATTIKASAAFYAKNPIPGGNSTLIELGGWNSAIADGKQHVSHLTIDGEGHQLNIGINVNSRNYLGFHDITIRDCALTALNLNGLIPNSATWPQTPDGPANLPQDTDYIHNIVIDDSTFSNSGQTPVGPKINWSYGTIGLWGVRDAVITRVLIDESTYGGFNIKGIWAKNIEISACDCRLKPVSPWGGKGDAVEISRLTNADIFDNVTNGGFSLQGDRIHVHHNRVVMPVTESVFAVEFAAFRSTVDHNYFEGASAMLIEDSDTVSINNNTFRGGVGAVLLDGENLVTPITNVNIDNNTLDNMQGIYGSGAIGVRIQQAQAFISNTNIRNNIVQNGSTAAGDHGAGITLSGLNGNIDDGLIANISGTTIANNVFYNNPGGDIVPTPSKMPQYSPGTTLSANVFGVSPNFNAVLPSPAPYYLLGSSSPARAAGAFIGLPSLGDGLPDAGSYVAPFGTFEAEMNYSVKADLGSNPITASFMGADAGGMHAVSLLDSGDAIRVHFFVPSSGQYLLSMRLRSGDASGPNSLFTGCYKFKVDGRPATFTADLSSPVYSSAAGGLYWGNMNLVAPALSAGLHNVEVSAGCPWLFVDKLQVSPSP